MDVDVAVAVVVDVDADVPAVAGSLGERGRGPGEEASEEDNSCQAPRAICMEWWATQSPVQLDRPRCRTKQGLDVLWGPKKSDDQINCASDESRRPCHSHSVSDDLIR